MMGWKPAHKSSSNVINTGTFEKSFDNECILQGEAGEMSESPSQNSVKDLFNSTEFVRAKFFIKNPQLRIIHYEYANIR